jgi:hypothetical protein
MRRALLCLALLCCPLASAGEGAGAVKANAPPGMPAVMLVWGGGTTRKEAEAALADYQTRSKPWRDTLELGEDFPKVLEGGSVPGLKPGSFVVALGVCAPSEAEAPLTLYKGLEPNVSSREVTWPAPLKEHSCPEVVEFWSGPTIHRMKKKDLVLTGVLFSFYFQDTDDLGAEHWWLLLHLRDAKGKVLETQLVVPGTDWSDPMSFEPDGAGLVLTDEYVRPSCVLGSRYKAFRRSMTFTIAGKKIGRREERKVAEDECGSR